LPVVSPSIVLTHAADAVARVVMRLWPAETVRVGPQLPSVTNYVTTVQVGEARFVAKYSVLGVSLVSVVRGVRGPWSKVETAQRDYVRDPRALLARERTQLRLLNGLTRHEADLLQVPEVIAYEAGVLITAAVDGPSLATVLLQDQVQALELLTGVVHAAQGLHRDPILAGLLLAAEPDHPRPHTSITGTFFRKFLGPGGRAYRDRLGEGWTEPPTQIAAALTTVGETLVPLLRKPPYRTVIYGDLKPEHILLGHTGKQTWLDPGLQHCDPCADIAKLISRTALMIITTRPSRARVTELTDALDALVTMQMSGHSRTDSEGMMRRLLALWVADWMNYLTTGLSVPPDSGLPLPSILLDATAQAEPLLQVTRAAATAMVHDPAQAWEIMLNGIHQLVTWPCR
jgi:hypothetical protein